MKFSEFTSYLTSLQEVSSRIEITKLLSTLFEKLPVTEIREGSYLLTGSVGPLYSGLIFNVAEKMILRAMSEAYDTELAAVTAQYKQLGDLGLTAHYYAKSKKTNTEKSVHDVFTHLIELTKESGEGSQEKRIQLIASFLKTSAPSEALYYIRILTGNVRLGFSEKTMIDALSWMETGDKSASAGIGKAFEVIPDIGEIAYRVKKDGSQSLTKHLVPVVGIPVMPMLCQRLKSPAEMVAKMGEVSVEPKFDGLRVLIHYSKSKNILKCFTRNLKDISPMFPELMEISDHMHADSIILDTEAVGMDPELMKIADFQTTMQRRRKHEIEDIRSKIPVTFQVFDILFKDGESVMDMPYRERRALLTKTIKNGSLLKVDAFDITTDPLRIESLHHEYREQGLEGIIVKKVDSTYVPGRFGWRWVKMKEAEKATGKLSDTVDAVIMGYSVGQGKRVGFGIGQFLAGIIDGETIKTVTKVGTGLTDDQFKKLSETLAQLKVADKPAEYEVHKNLTPDYWVKPSVVVELAADDITVSPNHTAGLALRFPRLVKMRDDKDVSNATSLKELMHLFKLQKK